MTCGWLNGISFLNIVKKMVSAVSIYYEVHCIETVSNNTRSSYLYSVGHCHFVWTFFLPYHVTYEYDSSTYLFGCALYSTEITPA
jgi:hypothetical protein